MSMRKNYIQGLSTYIEKKINNLNGLIWGAPQKLDKNLIKLFDFEFGILPDSFSV